MAKRRRRLKPGGPRKQYTSTAQVRMLSISQRTVFKYHLTQALDGSEMRDDQKQTFIANVLSKASMASIEEAKGYVKSVVGEGHLEDELSRRVLSLLDKYSTRR